ncbi:XdhC family protein [Niallia sp. Krafla_26]|uniref:XdhC family protein n=1 Tax=Niallia sp. Krafla_26 TaxID=3064703 RepID=UPI003D181B46
MSRLSEFRSIVDSIHEAWERKKKAAIVMLIGVNGSAYRLPGTKMMMAEDMEMVGTISGGCLEGDLFAYAERALKEGTPILKNYDLDENEIWGLGIGCKGSLEIFILPIQENESFWELTKRQIQREEEFCLITEIPSGIKALVSKDGDIIGDTDILPSDVYEKGYARISSQSRAEIIEHNDKRYVLDVIRPSQKLVVAGAGKDAIPVAELAAKAGFQVTVLDPRSDFNNKRYFPNVEHLICDPEDLQPNVMGDRWWVIMNHLQHRDESALQLALNSNPKYIGVLGPVSRTKEMLVNLGADSTNIDTIYSPVGLDIGAETMEEVAISIVSELLTVRNNRTGMPLKGKVKIHA